MVHDFEKISNLVRNSHLRKLIYSNQFFYKTKKKNEFQVPNWSISIWYKEINKMLPLQILLDERKFFQKK